MMEILAVIFTGVPYVISLLLALGLAILFVLCYGRIGAGLTVIATAFVLDVLTQSAPVLNLGITLYIADLPMILIGAVAGLRWIFSREIPKRHVGWVIFALVFFVDLAIGLARHGTAAGVQARNDFYSVAAASYAMSFVIGRPQIRQMLAAIFGVAVFLMLLCAYRWTVYYGNYRDLLPPGGTYNVDGAIRVIGASAALVLAQALIVGLYFGKLGGAASALRGLALFTLSAVLVLQHRSVWLAGLVGAAFSFLLARAQRVSRAQQILIMSIVMITAAIGLTFGGKITEGIRTSASRAISGEDTVTARFKNWKATLTDWKDGGARSILIGREFGAEVKGTVVSSSGENVRISFGAHNIYVSLLTSTGLIGLAALLWAISATLKNLYRHCKLGGDDAPFAALMLVLMAIQLTYYVAYSTDFLQFTIFGLALALAHRVTEPSPAQEIPKQISRYGRRSNAFTL
jgi:O-antigen ligase